MSKINYTFQGPNSVNLFLTKATIFVRKSNILFLSKNIKLHDLQLKVLPLDTKINLQNRFCKLKCENFFSQVQISSEKKLFILPFKDIEAMEAYNENIIGFTGNLWPKLTGEESCTIIEKQKYEIFGGDKENRGFVIYQFEGNLIKKSLMEGESINIKASHLVIKNVGLQLKRKMRYWVTCYDIKGPSKPFFD